MLPIGSPLGTLDLRFALRPSIGGCTGAVVMHYFAMVQDIRDLGQVSGERSP